MKSVVFALIAMALLAGLFFLFKPPETPSPAKTTGLAPESSFAAAPASTADRIGGAPESAARAEASVPGSPSAIPSATASNVTSDVMHVDLVVAHGRLVSGPTVVKVMKNDRVVLSVTSDRADELHVHGINLHLKLKPGQTDSLDFVASVTGRFTYELHRADIELGALEVYPR
jgi:hypothetical protein